MGENGRHGEEGKGREGVTLTFIYREGNNKRGGKGGWEKGCYLAAIHRKKNKGTREPRGGIGGGLWCHYSRNRKQRREGDWKRNNKHENGKHKVRV